MSSKRAAERIRRVLRIREVKRVSLALLLLAALPAAAQREICRFRALDAENPFRRWLHSQEVTCVSGDAAAEFPPGLWNVFVRAAGEVSSSPMLVDGDAAPATIAPAMSPGATVTALLPEAHGGVIYVPRRGSAFPLADARALVPADEPLWLFVLDKATPVAVIPIAALAPGSERAVDARGGGPASLVGWLQVPEADRSVLATATGVTAPIVRAGSREADLLPPPSLLHGAFFRVRDVAPGNAELRVEGRGWLPHRRVVKVQPGVAIAHVPLVVRASGTLMVRWNAEDDLVALDRSVGSCEEPEPPRLTVLVSKCPAPRRGQPFDAADCREIRREEGEGTFGSVTFDDVEPGLYRAEMRFGGLPPSYATARVTPLQIAELPVSASYFTAYGSVTRGGEPLREPVRIAFPGGVGFAPAETEEYRAVFHPPGFDTDAQLEVIACDGLPRAIVLVDEPLRPHGRFDIDIPANELRIHVNDTFTREALPGAVVKLEAMSLRRPRVVFETTSIADASGNVVFTGVPVRELHLTVTHGGYDKRIVEPFTMSKRGKKTIDAQLVPLRGTRGKIVADRPIHDGVVVWFSPAGVETERAELALDGTFVYANRHTADETMAVISTSHSLWVLRAPATEGRESLSVAFPNAPNVSFDVWLDAVVPARETRYIGVAIGGVRIPQPVLAQHQTLRREAPLMRGSGPQHFHDLLATGPIDVLLGPSVDEVPSRARSLDLFALPQFANAPRQRLGPGTSDVVLTMLPPP
jgi:hypothetical protein